jgi:hypothetical protein
MPSMTGPGVAVLALLALQVVMPARITRADEPVRALRPHGRRDAANTPNALMRGGFAPTAAPIPRSAPPLAPAPSAPSGPSEPVHLPKVLPSSDCRRPPPRRHLVRLALKPEAELGDVLAWVSSVTCKQFLLPGTIPANSKKVTITAPRLMTVAEAYQLFLSALDLVGLTVESDGRFLRIIETSKARTSAPFELGRADPDDDASAPAPLVTRLVRLEHVDAAHAAALLGALASAKGHIVTTPPSDLIITDSAANIERMLAALPAIDHGPDRAPE